MKILSQIAEDVYHVEIRLDRIKTNTQTAGAIALQLGELMMSDPNGVTRDVYEKLCHLLDVLPVTDSAKHEFKRRIDCTDGRWYLKGGDE